MAKFSDVAPAPAPREWQGTYLRKDEKRAALGEVFTITYLEFRPNGYMGKAEWDVGVVHVASEDEWTITLTDNPVRHAMFTALAKALAEGTPIDPVVFCEVGKARAGGSAPLGFRDATADEIGTAMTDRLDIARRRLAAAEAGLPPAAQPEPADEEAPALAEASEPRRAPAWVRW